MADSETNISPRRQFLRNAGLVVAAGGAGYLVGTRNPTTAKGGDIQDTNLADIHLKKFKEGATEIYQRHFAQTKSQAAALKAKYLEQAAIGEMDVLDAFAQLELCVDPTDTTLIYTSQLVHTLQVLEGMQADGIKDPDMHIAAATHDLGKLLLLTDELPENVVCANRPIGEYADGIGLNNVTFQWNHDEFIYDRVKEYVPEHVAWLVRFHSIDFPTCTHLFDRQDKHYFEKYLQPFRKYDQYTKSTTHLPKRRMSDYEDLLLKYLPKRMVI